VDLCINNQENLENANITDRFHARAKVFID